MGVVRGKGEDVEDDGIYTLEDNGECMGTGQNTSDAHFIRVSEVFLCLLALLWLYLIFIAYGLHNIEMLLQYNQQHQSHVLYR